MSRTPDKEDLAQEQREWTMMEGWQRYRRMQGMRDNPPHKTDYPHPRLPAFLRPRNGVHRPIQTG